MNWFSSISHQINGSIPKSLFVILLIYSFSNQFLPIEPYFVPYLTSIKHFTDYQLTVDIFPLSVYSQLLFTLLLAPACYYFSHKAVLILGTFGLLLTYTITWGGQSVLAMQIMEVVYGFGQSARLAFAPYIFLLVTEEEYQTMISLTTTVSLLSFTVASELSQLLALEGVPYDVFLLISLSSLAICFITAFFFPKEKSSNSIPSIATFWAQNKGWKCILEETWNSRKLQILSLWWAIAFAGSSLVQNYGTNLFDSIDSKSNLNGHIIAISQAAGGLGSYSAVYMETFATKSGLFIYILGSTLMGVLCMSMGVYVNIWAAYVLYIVITGIYQTLSCLVSVRCGRLLSNGQFILLFSINNFAGLLIESLIQATVELLGLTIFSQFIFFAGFFFLSTAIFIGLCFINDGEKSTEYSLMDEESIENSDNI